MQAAHLCQGDHGRGTYDDVYRHVPYSCPTGLRRHVRSSGKGDGGTVVSYSCEVPRCTGHLGKFSNCLSEALWNLGEDYADESGGNSDAHGYHMMFLFHHNTWLSDYAGDSFGHCDTPDFQIAGDTYVILTQTDSGQVFGEAYESETEARDAYDVYDRAYGEWMEANEY